MVNDIALVVHNNMTILYLLVSAIMAFMFAAMPTNTLHEQRNKKGIRKVRIAIFVCCIFYVFLIAFLIVQELRSLSLYFIERIVLSDTIVNNVIWVTTISMLMIVPFSIVGVSEIRKSKKECSEWSANKAYIVITVHGFFQASLWIATLVFLFRFWYTNNNL